MSAPGASPNSLIQLITPSWCHSLYTTSLYFPFGKANCTSNRCHVSDFIFFKLLPSMLKRKAICLKTLYISGSPQNRFRN